MAAAPSDKKALDREATSRGIVRAAWFEYRYDVHPIATNTREHWSTERDFEKATTQGEAWY